MRFSFKFIRGSEVAFKKRNKRKRKLSSESKSSPIRSHKHEHLQMNKRRDYERQSSSMPSNNGSRNPEEHLIFAAVCVVLPAERWVYLQTASFSHVLDVGSLQLRRIFVPVRWGLFADSLQSVQGAFDVTDLCSEGVYGLHGTIQLLAASHQSVHALWEATCKAGDENAGAKVNEMMAT